MSGSLRVLLIAALICVGGAAGYLAARLTRATHPSSLDTSAAVSAANVRLPQTPPEDARPHPERVPSSVPDLVLPDMDGVQHALSEWKGRPLLINFWATWCEPCRREIPLLKALRRQHSADRLEIIGIAVDGRDAVRSYARRQGIDYPVLVDQGRGLNAIAAFGMQAVLPFSVFVDLQGRIVTLKVGELHPQEAQYILDEMRAIEQGRVQLTAARQDIANAIAGFAAQRARRAANGSPAPQDR
ncbi:MAG TPA: TlpA disulfide reductase family protein [Steroidobacteraceae bacterium]